MRVNLREMRPVLAAFAANLAIAIAKFIAFLLTGSASMLAESVHSVADTGNEVLLLVGRGRSDRPASPEHPFGFGRERYFYGFIVSVMLFTVGAAFSVYDGIHKLLNPETIDSPAIAFAVLGLSAVAEAFSLRTGIREANQVRGDRSWGAFIRRSKAPELPVVLLEDTAALVGLVFAFAGVGLSVLTGDGRWDGAGSLAIGVLLAVAAAILAVEMKSLLIGEAASRDVQHQIVQALEDGPELVRVIHLRTVHIGPDSVLVAAKVGVRETDTAAQISAGINAAEGRVRVAVPIATTIYLEPDIYHPNLADQENPSIQAAESNRTSRRNRPAATDLPAADLPAADLPATDLPATDLPAGEEPQPYPRPAIRPSTPLSRHRVELPPGKWGESPRNHAGTGVSGIGPPPLSRGRAGAGRVPSRSPGPGPAWAGCAQAAGRDRPRPPAPKARPAPASRTPATRG